jgi:hypothetical protein
VRDLPAKSLPVAASHTTRAPANASASGREDTKAPAGEGGEPGAAGSALTETVPTELLRFDPVASAARWNQNQKLNSPQFAAARAREVGPRPPQHAGSSLVTGVDQGVEFSLPGVDAGLAALLTNEPQMVRPTHRESGLVETVQQHYRFFMYLYSTGLRRIREFTTHGLPIIIALFFWFIVIVEESITCNMLFDST